MDKSIYVLILLVMGLAIAYTTSRSSNKREKIHGGAVSRVLNYLASGLLAMLAPTVLCNIIFIHPEFLGKIEPFGLPLTTITHAFFIALSLVGSALVLLMLLAFLEKPHLDKLVNQEDKGWTKEDAETSGL